MLQDLDVSDGMKSICLRYFNAAGASPIADIGENHIPETHLIPLIMRSILDNKYTLTVFGTDYPTPDGTCIRDYIHVNDLATAHVLALDFLLAQKKSDVFNLGNEAGFSVNEVIQSTEKIAGKNVKLIMGKSVPEILLFLWLHQVKLKIIYTGRVNLMRLIKLLKQHGSGNRAGNEKDIDADQRNRRQN